jgi:hypothetical protein
MDVNLLSLDSNLRFIVECDLWRIRRGAHIGEKRNVGGSYTIYMAMVKLNQGM